MTEVNHTERAHSEIGASSASRWLACPASVSRSRGIEDSGGSSFAAEGTAAHELSEHCLEKGVDADECIGMEFNGFTVDAEMAGHVQYYVNNMRAYIDGDEYDTFIEEKFYLKNIHEDMYGSNDFCAMGIQNGELLIADFKYGKGINVSAKENIQLIIYALGAYHDSQFIYDFKTVKLVVVQPRIEGQEWDEWVIPVEELLDYESKLKEGVKEVYSENPSAKAGDHCKFCKVKATCPTIKAQAEEMIQTSFDDIPIESNPVLPEPSSLDEETISKILTNSKLIEDWLKSVSKHACNLLEKGKEIQGFKLVVAKTHRKIKDEKELLESFEETFGDKLYQKRKLETLGKLEKLVGKKELEPYLFKPLGASQIAPASDKRPAIVPMIEDAFEDVPLEEDNNEYSDMEF